MTDQAKRWTTSNGRFIHYNDETIASAIDAETASRLAACADLLRWVGDLEAVAVMTWADVEAIRYALQWSTERIPSAVCREALALLPVPPKGDAS